MQNVKVAQLVVFQLFQLETPYWTLWHVRLNTVPCVRVPLGSCCLCIVQLKTEKEPNRAAASGWLQSALSQIAGQTCCCCTPDIVQPHSVELHIHTHTHTRPFPLFGQESPQIHHVSMKRPTLITSFT